MFFLRQHIRQGKTLLASLLLALFLLSNYGVNFIHQEYHERPSSDTKTEQKHQHNCLVCDFQSLLYEPLSAIYFDFEQDSQVEFEPVKSYFYTFSLLEYHSDICPRGPPISLVLS